ncbi:MAG TPA: TRAP transporter TatT component family protein [Aridibacter sp.]|nr:TRAP transporter TatT component family protein [Aridibacter sp.]
MKHQKAYKRVRKLIDERELDDENLDAANGELLDLLDEDPECAWAYGLLSEIYYWTGEYADADEKLFYFNEGVEYGEKGVELDEECVEANFWLAANWGSYGQEKGIMKSLSLVNLIKAAVERVIEQDESYFYGGPYRILGRLYHKAPGFPISIGDNRKAEENLMKAVELGPKFFLNHLFLAELYISMLEKEKARKQLEWIIEIPPNKNHEREDEGYKERAEKLLESL